MSGPRRSPSGVLTRLTCKLGQLFRTVALCGGHRHVRVASLWLADFRTMGQLAADAPVTIVNGPISVMRARLRTWLARQP